MKSLISSRSFKDITRCAIALESRGIVIEQCMDVPHFPNEYLIKVKEEDYSRAMKIIYPGRDTPHVINPVFLMSQKEFEAEFGKITA